MSDQNLSVLSPDQTIPVEDSNENGSSSSNYIRNKITTFNKGRLYLVYLDTIATTFKKSFLNKYFGVLGLIYIFRLSCNFFSIAKEIFTLPIGKKKFSIELLKANFIKAIEDGDRLSEMANDAVWFAINLACFLVNSAVSIALTVAGCCFDAINESVMLVRDWRDFNKIKKMKTDLEELERQKALLQTLDGEKKIVEKSPIEEKINNLNKEIKELESGNPNLISAKDTMSFLKKPLYNFALDVSLSVGLALCLIPPTVIIGAFVLCVGLTLWTTDIISTLWDNAAKRHSSEKLNTPGSQGGSTKVIKRTLSLKTQRAGKDVEERPYNSASENQVQLQPQRFGNQQNILFPRQRTGFTQVINPTEDWKLSP